MDIEDGVDPFCQLQTLHTLCSSIHSASKWTLLVRHHETSRVETFSDWFPSRSALSPFFFLFFFLSQLPRWWKHRNYHAPNMQDFKSFCKFCSYNVQGYRMDLVIDFFVFLISIFSSVSNKFKDLSFNAVDLCNCYRTFGYQFDIDINIWYWYLIRLVVLLDFGIKLNTNEKWRFLNKIPIKCLFTLGSLKWE